MKRIVLAIILLGSVCGSVFAETVTMKSGLVREGTIIEKTDEYIKLETENGVLRIRFRMMDALSAADLQRMANFTREPVVIPEPVIPTPPAVLPTPAPPSEPEPVPVPEPEPQAAPVEPPAVEPRSPLETPVWSVPEEESNAPMWMIIAVPLVAIAFALVSLFLYIATIVDACRSRTFDTTAKVIWALALFFLSPISTFIYIFFISKKPLFIRLFFLTLILFVLAIFGMFKGAALSMPQTV